MRNETLKRSGGQVLVDALRIHGVERVFGVPGESYLAALDAFHDMPPMVARLEVESSGAKNRP